MLVECKMCDQDKGPVIQGLALDMDDVIKNHVIPDTYDAEMFNGLEDVKAVGFYVNDIFDAMMLERNFRSFSKAAPAEDDKVE